MRGTRSSGLILAWVLLAFVSRPAAVADEAPVYPVVATTESQTTEIRRLTSVEATPGDEGVRVFLGSDGPITARPLLLSSPDRLVLDLHNVQAAVKTSRIQVDSQAVTRVRVGQHQEGNQPVARVVLDLNGAQPYSVKDAPGGLLVTVGGHAVPAAQAPADGATAKAGSGFPADDSLLAADPIDAAVAGKAGAAHAEGPSPAKAYEDPVQMASASVPGATAASTVPAAEIRTPAMAAPKPAAAQASNSVAPAAPSSFASSHAAQSSDITTTGPQGAIYESKKITEASNTFTGKRISLNLVDADIKQVFRLFHEISGLNFVLDPSVSGNVTIVLDEVPWDQALDIILKNNGLDKVYEENVIRIATTQKLASEAGGRKALKEAKELEVEPVTITRRLSYAKAKEVDNIIRTGVLLSQRGKSFFDDRTNTLIVTDVPTKIEPLDRLVTALDEKTPQVMIEARIVLTGRDFIQDLGIDWGFTLDKNTPNPSTGPNFPNHGDVTYALNLPRAAGANRLAFNLFNHSGSFKLNIALDALETDGKSRTISAPKIATQNNVKAEIEQGVQIPYATSTATLVNVQFIAASLRLSVTPQITAEGTVIMDITVENNQPSKTTSTIGGQSVPGIDTQRAQTKVMVDDGGTTVIGGIFSVTESSSESGVPWFRKIPVFGWLFKSRNITTQNRELLIFITPKILRSV